jgi:hypothetical protein
MHSSIDRDLWTPGGLARKPLVRSATFDNRAIAGVIGNKLTSLEIAFSKNGTVDSIPDLTVVREILSCFDDHGIVGAIGGSGLLAALGLTQVVRDWDITTDSVPSSVERALVEVGYPYRCGTVGVGTFASAALYIVEAETHEVDVIVGFAVRVEGQRIELPTRVTGIWRSLPLADPTVWEQAYRAMGETAKADLLESWQDPAGSVF